MRRIRTIAVLPLFLLSAGCASDPAPFVRLPAVAELSDSAPTAIVRAATNLPEGTKVHAQYQLVGEMTGTGSGSNTVRRGVIVVAATNPACFRADDGPVDGFNVKIVAEGVTAAKHYDWPPGICDRAP